MEVEFDFDKNLDEMSKEQFVKLYDITNKQYNKLKLMREQAKKDFMISEKQKQMIKNYRHIIGSRIIKIFLGRSGIILSTSKGNFILGNKTFINRFSNNVELHELDKQTFADEIM